jgi:hypothetical protein
MAREVSVRTKAGDISSPASRFAIDGLEITGYTSH